MVSKASWVSKVGTAPAQERLAGILEMPTPTPEPVTPKAPGLCSGLWPGRGEGLGMLGEPGQLVLAGDMAVKGES